MSSYRRVSRAPDLPTTSVPRSWKAREVRVHLAIAGAAGAGALALHRQDLPDGQLFFRSIVWFTVLAALMSLAYVVAVLAVRRFPAAREARLGGRPAVLLPTWAGPWCLTTALDASLLALTGLWVVLAWTSDVPDRLLLVGLALVPFAWFTGRWVVRGLGRCRREALWVTDDEIVHDSERGRSRVARAEVVRVQGWDDADGDATDVVAVISSVAARREFGPRLLTLTRGPRSATRTSIETTRMAHSAPAIAEWLSG